ncbi:MAG: glycosyltransferase family 2 protein [Desulfobacterales bacterium]|jgi:glycosyltransferase involved in cell wall biosynthesis
MKKKPFFSIISATKNSKHTLARTLNSVARQTFTSLEHIVIDGASTDGTQSLLKERQKSYALTWISEPDSGISAALNKGIALSQGRYILVVHGDDRLLAKNTIESVYSILRKENIEILSHPVLKEYQVGAMRPYRPIPVLWWHHFKTIFPHQGCFVHRRIFERIGGFREDLKIALDYDFFYRALNEKPTVRFRPEPVAIMGGSGISSNSDWLARRLEEERKVQCENETNPIVRIFQLLFRTAYEPYRLRLRSALTRKDRRTSDG